MIVQTSTERQRNINNRKFNRHGPADIIVAVQEGDVGGLALAEYYCGVRGIPLANIEMFPGTWRARSVPADALMDENRGGDATADELEAYYARVCGIVRARARIGAIVLMHWWPVAGAGDTNVGGIAGGAAFQRLLSIPFAAAGRSSSVRSDLPSRADGGAGVAVLTSDLVTAGGQNLSLLDASGLRSSPDMSLTEGPIFFQSTYKPSRGYAGPNWRRNWPANAYDIIVNQCELPEYFVRVPIFQIGGPSFEGSMGQPAGIPEPGVWGPDTLPARERRALAYAKKIIDNSIAGEAAQYEIWARLYIKNDQMSGIIPTEHAWSEITQLDVPFTGIHQIMSTENPVRSDVLQYYNPFLPALATKSGRGPTDPVEGDGLMMVGRSDNSGAIPANEFVLPGCITFGGRSFQLPAPGQPFVDAGGARVDWVEVAGGGAVIIHGFTWGGVHILSTEAGTSSGLIYHLSQGCCMSEFWLHTHGMMPSSRSVIIGDPLYRPFNHWTGRFPE